MQKFPNDWDLKTRIDFLQRKIILNSIAYYMFDTNFISDREYDALCKQLVKMHEEYGDIWDTQYGYAFYEYDGSTGFDLFYRLTDHDQVYLSNIVHRKVHGMKEGGDAVGSGKNKRRKKKT